jgi:NNP family nitrate/nitrite transporter-like MFS transporter
MLPSATHEPAAGRWRMLNLTWVSFFLTFVVWFNLAPFASTIGKALHLTADQVKTLLICNVALTIPARILVGQLVDRFGPRRVFTWLLVGVAVPCTLCAFATNFWQMVVGRLLVSCVGAGFVVGIRLVGEWFDAGEIGTAEGIYGGLGNFGMAAATFALPLVAVALGGANGWRWAMAMSGVLCVAWAVFFYRHAEDAPAGAEFRKPKKRGALEVCTRGDLLSLALMQIPLVACLGLLAWKLVGVGLLPAWGGYVCYGVLALVLVHQMRKVVQVNRSVLTDPLGEAVPANERYSFAQVAILCLCYAVTFGGELAVESMLPHHFEKMFGVSVATAGVMGAGFAFASLIARPLGGWMGDKLGRRPIMIASLGGSALGYFALYRIGPTWSVGTATAVVVLVGFFLMAGNGANFCIAPLIRKPLTGQIAGLVGAYGNVGSVLFLTLLSLTGPTPFFLAMAGTALAAFGCCFLLKEPAPVPHTVAEEQTPAELAAAVA